MKVRSKVTQFTYKEINGDDVHPPGMGVDIMAIVKQLADHGGVALADHAIDHHAGLDPVVVRNPRQTLDAAHHAVVRP